MRISNKIAIAAVAMLILTAALTPAEAACGGNPLIATNEGATASFVWTEGWDANYFAGYPPFSYVRCYALSANAFGTFWALGAGDPAAEAGNDADTFTFPAYPWMYYNATYYGASWYAAEIFAGWGANAAIDGCIQSQPANACTCVLLTDQDGSTGYFALASGRAADLTWDTFLTQPGSDGAGNSAPIVLAPIPAPVIVSSIALPSQDLNITANVDMPADGIYQSGDDCVCGPISYKVMMAIGATSPATRDAAAWTAAALIGGGAQDWNPMGTPVAIESLCGGADSVWLTTWLRFDSGFDSPVVSGDATEIACDPTLADPVDVKPRNRRGEQSPVRTPSRSR